MKKVLLIMSIVCVLTFAMATVAYATGTPASPAPTDSVSKVIQDGFETVKVQAEEILFNVVLWVLIAATIIFLIVKIVGAVITYRQGAGVSVFPIVAAVVVLILLLVVPRALWALL